MTRRRLAALAFAVALAGGAGTAAHAATGDVDTVTDQQRRYWACLAIDHVEIGACLENPLPDPSGWPHPTDIVEDRVGDLPV